GDIAQAEADRITRRGVELGCDRVGHGDLVRTEVAERTLLDIEIEDPPEVAGCDRGGDVAVEVTAGVDGGPVHADGDAGRIRHGDVGRGGGGQTDRSGCDDVVGDDPLDTLPASLVGVRHLLEHTHAG